MEKLAEGKNFLQDWKFATNTDFSNNLDSPPSLTSSTRRCVTFNCRKSLIFPDNLNFTNFFDYPQDFFFLFSVFSLLRSPPELYTVFFHKAKAAPTRNLPVNHQHQRAASTLCEFSMIFPSLRFSVALLLHKKFVGAGVGEWKCNFQWNILLLCCLSGEKRAHVLVGEEFSSGWQEKEGCW